MFNRRHANSKKPEPGTKRPRASGGHKCKSCIYAAKPNCLKRGTFYRYWHDACPEYERNPETRAASKIKDGSMPTRDNMRTDTEWVDRKCMQCDIKPYERPVGTDYHMCSDCRERVNRLAESHADDEPAVCL